MRRRADEGPAGRVASLSGRWRSSPPASLDARYRYGAVVKSMVSPRRSVRWMWIAVGFVAVGVGFVGAVVPGLPTTAFMVFAASCFARSSPRFERWLLDLPAVGPAVRDYRAGLGMPRRSKIVAVTMIAVAVSGSAVLGVDRWWLRTVIVAAGLFGMYYVWCRVPTKPEAGPEPSPEADDNPIGDRTRR